MRRLVSTAFALAWFFLWAPLQAATVFLLDDFDDPGLNGAPPQRANLFGGIWAASVSQGSLTVSYNNPGADGTPRSAKVTGRFGGTGYAVYFCSLTKDSKPWDAAAEGLTGVQFWMRGDGNPYRINVMSQAVTDSNYYGFEVAPPWRWTFYQIPFSKMIRLSFWGTQKDLPDHPLPRDLTGFQVVPQKPGFFSYGLDQVGWTIGAASAPTASLPPPQKPFAPPNWPTEFNLTFSDGPGLYEAEVLDSNGLLIRILLRQSVMAPCSSWVQWDGRDSKGIETPPGRYEVILFKNGKFLKTSPLMKP